MPDTCELVIAIVCADIVLIRPYASVPTINDCEALPVVATPGPVAGNVTAVPLIDKLPAPELVLNTRVPLSNTEPAYSAPTIPAPPATVNAPVVVLVDTVVF